SSHCSACAEGEVEYRIRTRAAVGGIGILNDAPKIGSLAPSANSADVKVPPPSPVSTASILNARVSSTNGAEPADALRSTVRVTIPEMTLRSKNTSQSRSTLRTRICSGLEKE